MVLSVPEFYVVCGLPGVGKSTVARELVDDLEGDAELLRTDEIRIELTDDDPEYTDFETELVYIELAERANALLGKGFSVVADGTFRSQEQRGFMWPAGAKYGVKPRLIKVECEEEEVKRRLRSREGGVSDADVGVYESMEFEPIRTHYRTVDTTDDYSVSRLTSNN